MSAIRIVRRIDSETLQLPELKPFVGKIVEIVVTDEPAANGQSSNVYDAFFELAGQDVVDPEAYKRLRAASMI